MLNVQASSPTPSALPSLSCPDCKAYNGSYESIPFTVTANYSETVRTCVHRLPGCYLILVSITFQLNCLDSNHLIRLNLRCKLHRLQIQFQRPSFTPSPANSILTLFVPSTCVNQDKNENPMFPQQVGLDGTRARLFMDRYRVVGGVHTTHTPSWPHT